MLLNSSKFERFVVVLQAAVDEPADVWKQLAEHLMHCKARYGSQTYQKEHLYRTTGYVLDGDHDEQDL